MQVTATKQFQYGGKTRKPGDTFQMSADDARLMVGFGKVRAAEMKAASPETDEQKPRRAYRRRDMVAEGTMDV